MDQMWKDMANWKAHLYSGNLRTQDRPFEEEEAEAEGDSEFESEEESQRRAASGGSWKRGGTSCVPQAGNFITS